MLKQSLFITPRGSTYTIYEIDETNFYRLDIVRDNAEFNVQPEAVLYSVVRRKKTYKYGDDEIYREYMQFLREVNIARGKVTKESYWDQGKFYQKMIKSDESTGFLQETITENGPVNSMTVHAKG